MPDNKQYAYLESYSAMAAPPMRGYVITANWAGRQHRADPRKILGVVTRKRDVYSRRKPDATVETVLRGAYASEEAVLKDGFTFEHTATVILPTVLGGSLDRGDLILIFDPDPRRPADVGRVMYCQWPESEDEKRLQDQCEIVLEEMEKVRSAVT